MSAFQPEDGGSLPAGRQAMPIGRQGFRSPAPKSPYIL